MIMLAVGLPVLSLVALGSLWLWQSGFLIYWALAACAVTVVVYLFEVWMLRRPDVGRSAVVPLAKKDTVAGEMYKPGPVDRTLADDPSDSNNDIDPNWTKQEHRAWVAVQQLSQNIDTKRLTDKKDALDLGRETVQVVAHSLHPDARDPALQFTVPEALALIEQVSRRLRPFVLETIPLGDQITVGQAMQLYDWRSVIGLASKGYDLWRVVRILNPLSAATHEVRAQVTRKFYDWGRDALVRKLAQRYVEEVGRAAIDLYAGRLKISSDDLAKQVMPKTALDLEQAGAQMSEPLRVLIAGQVGVGKSSLINALSEEICAAVDVLPSTKTVTHHVLSREDMPEVLLLDMPGFDAVLWDKQNFTDEALACDLVVWVASALRADRELDRMALEAFTKRVAGEDKRHAPPVLLVLSHIDQLRPFKVWHPPYDLSDGDDPKSRSIAAVIKVLCGELSVSADDIVPVSLSGAHDHYNIDELWIRIHEVLPAAMAARLSRVFAEVEPRFYWSRLGAQAAEGVRVLKKTVTK